MSISFEDFKKIEIRIGEVISAEEVEGSEKLLKLRVSFGESGERQIVSGIKKYLNSPQEIVGKKYPFVFNLEPRTIFGLESQGMILCASDDQNFSFLEVKDQIEPGSLVK